jgi:ribose transport system substrate-binding protein
MAGVGPTVAEIDMFKQLAKANPQLKIVGIVYGQWTGSVAKSETLKFLATHPQKVDGVWSAGLMAVAAEQALAQSGRDLVPFTDSGNECSLIAFRHEHANIPSMSMVNGGAPNAYIGLLVASRLLSGQKLTVNTVVQPQPEITSETIGQYFQPAMTVQSTCWADPADKRFVADSYFDQFFTGGQKPVIEIKP